MARKRLSRPGSSRYFSELENLVLAMIWFGFKTGYDIIKEMKRARGGRWSTQSGAVYRIIRKHESLGLVECDTTKSNGRTTHFVKATAAGGEHVLNWVATEPDFSEIALLSDPIRSRAYFLAALDPPQQLKIVDRWIELNQGLIKSLQSDVDDSFWMGKKRDSFKLLAYSELVELAKARGQWLLAVRKHCEGEMANG